MNVYILQARLARRLALFTLLITCLAQPTLAAQAPRAAVPAAVDEAIEVVSIASSPAVPNVLVARLRKGGSAIPARYSIDGGVSWQPLSVDDSWSTEAVAVVPRTTNPPSPRFVLGDLRLVQSDIARSGDYGQSWAFTELPTYPATISASISSMQASLADPRVLLVQYSGMSSDGLFPPTDSYWSDAIMSTDAGVTWSDLGWPGRTSAAAPRAETRSHFHIIPSPVVRERLFATWFNYLGRGFSQSDDLGATWQQRSFPVGTLVPDGRDAAVLYGYGQPDRATYRDGKRSVDGGATWAPWASQPCDGPWLQMFASPTTARLLFVTCPGGMYRSRNGGDTWVRLTPIVGQLLTPDYSHPGRLLWARDDGLWESIDDGQNWRRVGFIQSQSWRVALPLLAR